MTHFIRDFSHSHRIKHQTQVGVVAFGFAKTANEAPNPMSMLSSMMQGGAGGGMDMNNMMSMLQGMQQQGGKR